MQPEKKRLSKMARKTKEDLVLEVRNRLLLLYKLPAISNWQVKEAKHLLLHIISQILIII